MRTYLISYELAKPHLKKHVVAQAVMALGQSWARPLEQTWYVRSNEKDHVLEARLARVLDEDDGLLIQPVEDDAVLTNTALRWFRQRRPGVDTGGETNVIAFPDRSEPPPQAEFPFAKAS